MAANAITHFPHLHIWMHPALYGLYIIENVYRNNIKKFLAITMHIIYGPNAQADVFALKSGQPIHMTQH